MSQAITDSHDEPLEAMEAPAASRPRVGFWRLPWVQAVVPWMTSLSVHIGIIVIALVLLASGALHDLLKPPAQRQVNVPTTVLAQENIGGLPNVGTMDDVTSQTAQLDPVQRSDNPLPQGEASSLEALMDAGSSEDRQSLTGITGMGSLAEALGGGAGGEGSTIFGEPGGGSRFMGFDVGVAGDGGAVNRVIFVCDASGSMEGRPKLLLVDQLRRAIDPLRPDQSFNVLFFRWDDYEAVFRDRMRPASPRFKGEAKESFDRLVARGSTNPLPALEAAFKQKPELIFLLTDGIFNQGATYEEIVEAIRRENRDKSVMINTIMFINRDEMAERVLRQIAEENGGEFRYVGAEDLQ